MKNPAMLTLLAFLAACGGSGGETLDTLPFIETDSAGPETGGETPVIIPLSDMGFAGQETGDETEATFTFPSTQRTIRTSEGVTRFERQNVSANIAFSDGTITLVIDGQSFELTGNPNDESELVFNDGTNFVALQVFDEVIDASAFESFAVLNGDLNESYVVLGLDTSPADVAARESTATFEGSVAVNLRRDEFIDAFGSGDFTLIANFDDGSIGGTAIVADDNASSADFNFDTITLSLEETAITGNGFAGGLSVQAGDINGELVSGGYEGRFFGEDAASAGGNLYGRIDVEDSDTDTFVNGYFLGQEGAE